MFVNSYKYKVSDTFENGRRIISSLNRNKHTSQVFDKELIEYIGGIKTSGRTALLVACGPAIHHSDSRNICNMAPFGGVAVKSQIGYNVYNIAKMFNCEIDFISTNTNTCASSMYSLYEAQQLFNLGYSDVMIVAVDIVDDVQELLFKQLGVNLICGDCISITHLSTNGIAEIKNVEWLWNNDKSPMSISSCGYEKVINRVTQNIDKKIIDIVKTHGSGTERNTTEELLAIENCNIDCKTIEYKSRIGHTQGASSIVEICIMIDNEDFSNAIVLASGLGGFYGGCMVSKN